MKRLIIDTSSYNELLILFSQEELRLLTKREEYAVEGFVIIRKELRDIPKQRMVDAAKDKKTKLRIALLSLYDYITKGRSYPLDDKMVDTAEKYFTSYVEQGGKNEWRDLENDFEIVACASHKQVDIVVSEDNKTMLSREALMAYEKVNSANKLHMPNFTNITDLKKELDNKYLRGVRLG